MPQIDNLSPAAEWVDIRSLVPWPANPKHHTSESTSLLAAGLRRFGFLVPITARRSDRMIAAGHGRHLAAMAIWKESPKWRPGNAPDGMGAWMVPVLFVDFDSEEQFQAFAIADNQHPKNAPTDDDAIAGMLRAMDADGLNLDGLGFSDEEIGMILEGAAGVDGGEWGDAMGGLPEGDRAPIQTMTFTLHDEQAATVKEAMEKARGMGPFVDTGNENGNGNALARICETFLGRSR